MAFLEVARKQYGMEVDWAGRILPAQRIWTAGNLYGATTSFGGSSDSGTVFELVNSTTSPGTYTMRILCTLTTGTEGGTPLVALMADGAGNLYGTASQGGADREGTAFELANISGNYVFNLLHDFGSSSTDGVSPQGALLEDIDGQALRNDLWRRNGWPGDRVHPTPSGPYVHPLSFQPPFRERDRGNAQRRSVCDRYEQRR